MLPKIPVVIVLGGTELVFEECRQPYIKQLSDEYRLFALILGGGSVIMLLISVFLWYKFLSLPRISVRSLSVMKAFFLNLARTV